MTTSIQNINSYAKYSYEYFLRSILIIPEASAVDFLANLSDLRSKYIIKYCKIDELIYRESILRLWLGHLKFLKTVLSTEFVVLSTEFVVLFFQKTIQFLKFVVLSTMKTILSTMKTILFFEFVVLFLRLIVLSTGLTTLLSRLTVLFFGKTTAFFE